MLHPNAWLNDRWVCEKELAIGMDDLGFLQSANVVDRLRTFKGRAWDTAQHVERFLDGCRQVGLPLTISSSRLEQIVHECARRSTEEQRGSDFSVVVIATAGANQRSALKPNLVVHAAALPWSKLADWYRHGQALMIAEPRNVPRACWSPSIKTRSRLHYFLADQQALALGAHAGAILLDLEGNLTETSVANVLLLENDGLVCPPLDSILNGISLTRTLRLAADLGIKITFDQCSPQRAFSASGIILTGTSGCLWYASKLVQARSDENLKELQTEFSADREEPCFRQLCEAWKRDVQIDYMEQACAKSDA